MDQEFYLAAQGAMRGIYDCLNTKYSAAEQDADKQLIINQFKKPLPELSEKLADLPFDTTTYAIENVMIKAYKQKIEQLRIPLEGKIKNTHAIPVSELENSLNATTNHFEDFLHERSMHLIKMVSQQGNEYTPKQKIDALLQVVSHEKDGMALKHPTPTSTHTILVSAFQRLTQLAIFMMPTREMKSQLVSWAKQGAAHADRALRDPRCEITDRFLCETLNHYNLLSFTCPKESYTARSQEIFERLHASKNLTFQEYGSILDHLVISVSKQLKSGSQEAAQKAVDKLIAAIQQTKIKLDQSTEREPETLRMANMSLQGHLAMLSEGVTKHPVLEPAINSLGELVRAVELKLAWLT